MKYLLDLLFGKRRKARIQSFPAEVGAAAVPPVVRKITTNVIYEHETKDLYVVFQDHNGRLITKHLAQDEVKTLHLPLEDQDLYYVSCRRSDCTFQTRLEHEECPGGLQVEASVHFQLFPCGLFFGDWVQKIESLSEEELCTGVQEEKYNIHIRQYLQKVISSSTDLELLLKYGTQAVTWSGNDSSLPPWFKILDLQIADIAVLPTAAQEQMRLYQEQMLSHARQVKEAEELLAKECQLNEIEEAKKDLAKENQLREIQRAAEIEQAQAAREYDRKQKELLLNKEELDLQIKRASLESLEAQTESQKKESQAILENLQLEKQKKELEFQLQQEQHATQQSIFRQKWDYEQEKLKLDLEYARKDLESQKKDQERKKELYELEKAKTFRENELISKMETSCSVITKLLLMIKEQQSLNFCRTVRELPVIDALMLRVMEQKTRREILLEKSGITSIIKNIEYAVSRDPALGKRSSSVEVNEIYENTPMALSFNSSRSGYLTLITLGSSLQAEDPGKRRGDGIVVLSPNVVDHQVHIEGGRKYSIPGDFLPGFQINQEGPAGLERVLCIVSEKPLITLPESLRNEFYKLTHSQLEELLEELNRLPGDSWAGGCLSYKVLPPRKEN